MNNLVSSDQAISCDPISVEVVSQKLFLIDKAPSKPMVSASCLYLSKYLYQIDIALYLPHDIEGIQILKWENNEYISQLQENDQDSIYREMTIRMLGFNQKKLKALLSNSNYIKFDLYMVQLSYSTNERDAAKNILVNYQYGDPETTRGTVTTVRDISETKSS
ncbi:hypothetical protein ABW636_14650 [Aquimarina sp. 2201CG1-2-11]|uniref:hypothetical protein n=1 Tax=Aquimarina discodermiae TaxID=3231043 RepID=UPI003461D836